MPNNNSASPEPDEIEMRDEKNCHTPDGGISIGMGVTADCNLNCMHCYSRPLRGQHLSFEQVMRFLENKKIASINFGTGESALHPDFTQIVKKCHEMGIKMSLTSNGYSIIKLSDTMLKTFNDLDISVEFSDSRKQDSFRKGESQMYIDAAVETCQRLGVEFSFTTAIMNINYREIPRLLQRAAQEGCNLRVNIFKPVPGTGTFSYYLDYDQFWEAVRLLFENGNLISCSEPIVNAMLNISCEVPKSPCGHKSLRIHPNGRIVPCVYWTESEIHIDGVDGSFRHIFQSSGFKKIGHIPEFCQTCNLVEICGGGCASRRYLNGKLDYPDDYCPLFLKREIPDIPVSYSSEPKDLVHSSYLCTMIFQGKK